MSRVALSFVSLSLDEDLLMTASLERMPPPPSVVETVDAIEAVVTRPDWPTDSYVGLDKATEGKEEEEVEVEQP